MTTETRQRLLEPPSFPPQTESFVERFAACSTLYIPYGSPGGIWHLRTGAYRDTFEFEESQSQLQGIACREGGWSERLALSSHVPYIRQTYYYYSSQLLCIHS